MAENDFLDAKAAQRRDSFEFGPVLSKLVSYAVITCLEVHPNRESMAPVLVVRHGEDGQYAMGSDLAQLSSVEEALESSRRALADDEDADAYAIVIDSADRFPDFPCERPLDSNGRPFDDEQPVIAVYLGQRARSEGALVVQAYRKRMLRGGASPLGAPLILPGPASLFVDL